MPEPNAKLKPLYNVLLIEDDPSYARLATIMLEESGSLNCSITHCHTLAEGMQQLLQGAHFEAVLLDLTLPDSQGFDTLSRLLTHFPNLNLIVLTGLDDKNLGVQAVKSGAQDFLVKGAFDENQLAKTLHYSIERNNILKRLEEIQRIAHIGHWECSPSEHYFQASEEVYHIFGLPSLHPFTCEELLQPDCPFNFLLGLQDQACVAGKVEKDTWIRRGDGEQRYISVVCSGRKLDAGGALFNGIIQDITERKQAQELKKAKDMAEHTAKVREQFIASVSHEMRTPMNAILGMAHLLRQANPDDEQLGYIHTIQQSSEILLGIINDILQMSAIQNGLLHIEQKPFQLSSLLQNLFDVLKYKAKEKGLDFTLQPAQGIPDLLMGDALRLSQVLYNLVGNAIKFTDSGYVQVNVALLEGQAGKVHLSFTVKDSGIGIPEEQLDVIFEPFSRLGQKERIYEGIGLGLPIARKLVEAHGGIIAARSRPGEGAEFSFSLWFDVGVPGAMGPAAPADTLPPEASFRLLLVEDHKMNQLVARKILERKWKNIEIFLAENGEQAIKLLEGLPVDIILMDIQMPVRDGLSTAQYIRQRMAAEISGIPILAMTAHADKTQAHILKEYGMNDFILKPFEPEQLFQKIQQYIKLSRPASNS